MNWEEVECGMKRASVHGGWLIREYEQRRCERNGRWEYCLVCGYFVPDATHEWTIGTQKSGKEEQHANTDI